MSLRLSAPAASVAASTLLLAAALVVAAPNAGGVAGDVTAPSLQVKAEFLVGAQIGTSNLMDEGSGGCYDWDDYTTVPFRVSWSASDPSGIWDYNTWTVTGTQPRGNGDWWLAGDPPSNEFRDSLDDYHDDCGGDPSARKYGWAITAYDGEMNAKYVGVDAKPAVVQENNTSASYIPSGTAITYSGTWRNGTCSCASGGRQMLTSQLGATATITVKDRSRIGLVMAKGPGRGQADILLDGARVATVDTRAPSNVNRYIVWARDLTPGTHVIKVRNLATAGRPRIDLDAVLL